MNTLFRTNKNLVDSEPLDLEHLRQPMTRSYYDYNSKEEYIYENEEVIKRTRPAKWDDRVRCKECSKFFTRSARSRHNATEYHKIYETLNKKLLYIMTSVYKPNE